MAAAPRGRPPRSDCRHHGGRVPAAPALSQRLVQTAGALERRARAEGGGRRQPRVAAPSFVPAGRGGPGPALPARVQAGVGAPGRPRAAAPAPQPLAIRAPALPALRRGASRGRLRRRPRRPLLPRPHRRSGGRRGAWCLAQRHRDAQTLRRPELQTTQRGRGGPGDDRPRRSFVGAPGSRPPAASDAASSNVLPAGWPAFGAAAVRVGDRGEAASAAPAAGAGAASGGWFTFLA